ncbi:hypothetical protein LINPERPRIM_LOCUS33118 [Linum perenne]
MGVGEASVEIGCGGGGKTIGQNRSVKTIDHRSRLMVRLTEIGQFFHIYFSVGQRLRIFQGRLTYG